MAPRRSPTAKRSAATRRRPPDEPPSPQLARRSPLLIGAITTLIVVVAVYLSYNANNGLPFVPTYNIKVALPEASGLEASNQVASAARAWAWSKNDAHAGPEDRARHGDRDLKLEKEAEPLPVDTKAIVQSVSSIGLKYVQLDKGTSQRELKIRADDPGHPGARTGEHRRPLQHVQHEDEDGEQGQPEQLRRWRSGPRARHQQHDRTLRPLVTNAIPVLRNLAAPATELREFFIALERYNAQAAPVAIARRPPSMSTSTPSSRPGPASRRHLEEATVARSAVARTGDSLAPLRGATSRKNRPNPFACYDRARSCSSPSRRRWPTRSPSVPSTCARPRRSTRSSPLQPRAGRIRARTRSSPWRWKTSPKRSSLANPLLAGLAPEQATCNYFTLAFRNLASLQSENIGVGTLARRASCSTRTGPTTRAFPSSAPASGPSVEHAFDSAAIINNNYLHANPYPNVTGPGQPANNCEAGQRDLHPGQDGRRQRAGHDGNRHEITTREQNLFGEKYPSSTLKTLGISTRSPSRAEGERADGPQTLVAAL